MAPRAAGLVIPSSPSFDSEAASQQLLAEASSPVQRQAVASPSGSITAQHGANLLNAARALPTSLAPPAARADALAKIGRLKSLKATKGKLPRASLAGLISESSQKKARGKQLYDLGPSPQKKRASLPPQIAHSENGEEDAILETSQVQPEDDVSAEIPEGLDVSAPTEAFGDDDIVDAPTSPLMPREEFPSAAKKQRGRPKRVGSNVTSTAVGRIEPEKVALLAPFQAEKDTSSALKKPQASPRQSGENATSVAAAEKVDGGVDHRTMVVPEDDLFKKPKKGRGHPRKSGESVVSQPSVFAFAEVDNEFRDAVVQNLQTQRPAAVMKSKRKGRPEHGIDTHTDGETGATSKPTKKIKKLKGPKMISPDEPEFEEDTLPPVATARQDASGARETSPQDPREIRRRERQQAAQEHADSQLRVEAPVSARQIRSSRARGYPATAPETSSTPAIVRKGAAAQHTAQKTRAVVASSATKRGKTNTQIHISFQDPTIVPEPDGEADEEAAQATSRVLKNGRKNRSQREADSGDSEEGRNEDDDVHNRQTPETEDADADGANEQVDDQDTASGIRLPALEQVFDFANGHERSGVCSVGLARKIDRFCDRARATLSRQDCTYDDIAECKDVLVRRLASINSKMEEDTRSDFKLDAFAYLFRALTLFLEAMYDKFQDEQGENGEVTESLSAMEVLYPFILEMLRFKDTMDSWKVKVQGHRPGDRLIKSVESDLIAPLRLVEKHSKKRLNALRRAESDRQARIEMQRQRERQEQEIVRREEALRSARRKRWQDLHIARMQYETDPYRRRWLRFVEPPDLKETDANGDPFERVPFFGKRSAPPPSSVFITSGKDWRPEQEMALLDALQSFDSLEDIFRNHCRPRGALREFSVSDFAAKLAWVRYSWAQLLHLHPDWELPEWVQKIPVLP